MKIENENPSCETTTQRVGGWLPNDKEKLDEWMDEALHVVEKSNAPFHPIMVKFQELIERDPEVYMYFTQMFTQIPPHQKPPRGSGNRKIKDYPQMLKVINHILTTAPEFNHTEMMALPITAILEFSMITPAGLSAFLSDKINAMFKEVLNVWATFLNSPESLYVMNATPKGWKCEDAKKALTMDEFKYDPHDKHWGYKSWNDFFIREFKDGKRPVAEPGNDKVITNACESVPFKIDTNVRRFSKFWLKSQPYSLEHMLAGTYVEQFIGGTVYQAFLSAKNYHRWHSPVSGTIKKAFVKDGTYYSEAAAEGFDDVGPKNSQGYIAHVATRALIFIESNDPVIGLMCVMPVGMVEVSSCNITVKDGQKVTKGDQLGYFQFGGSSHCLIFRPGAIAAFEPNAKPDPNSGIVNVKSKLAMAN